MRTGGSYRLKPRQQGYFAAGEEFRRALGVLGAGPFKLYAWMCLNAERASGRLSFERGALARRLGTSRSTLGRQLRELVQAGVCELERAPNQHRGSRLRVRSRYWPYEPAGVGSVPEAGAAETGPGRRRAPAGRLPASAAGSRDSDGECEYVAKVRQALQLRACVQASFGPGDERVASAWYRAGMPLPAVERAIMLGSARKSSSIINGNRWEPIVSLKYFEKTLEEVLSSEWPEGYWQHVERHVASCEAFWREQSGQPAGDGPGAGGKGSA